MKLLNARLVLLVLLISLAAVSVPAKTINRVAAVINDQIITTYQLDQAVMKALGNETERDRLSEAQFEELQTSVLEKLITEKLLDQQIEELGLQVSEKELEAAIADVEQKNGLSREGLIQALEAQGMTMAGYRRQVREEILRYKLMGREVNQRVQVTNSEIREYFRDHIDEYKVSPTIHLQRISLPQEASMNAAAATQLRQRLVAGEKAEQILADLEEDAQLTDMGQLGEEDLAEPLQQALKGLQPGEVSEPVVMNGQLHLFLVTDRNPGDPNLFDRVKGQIEETLRQQKTTTRFQEWQQELRAQAFVDIRL